MKYSEINENAPVGFEIFDKFHSKQAIREWVKTVMSECSDFFSQKGDGWLYRADTQFDYQVNIISSRERTPRQTNRHIHDTMVEEMVKRGAKAHRGNSFFCYNEADKTRIFDDLYGDKVFALIPFNGFHYSWLEGIDDFTIQQPMYDFGDSEEIDRFFEDYPLHVDEGLSTVLNPSRLEEVMVTGKCYMIAYSLVGYFEELV